jgi:hypothetical protein
MNERIWELAEQAITDDLPEPIAIPAEFVVRLAELIVKECASVVNSRDDSDTGFWANLIKEHFGVKE